MKSKIYYLIIGIFIIPLLGLSQVNLQNTNTSNGLVVGFDVGLTTFFGDIDEAPAKGDYMNNLAYRVSLRKNLGYWFFLEGQVIFGNLSGEKKRGTGEQLNYLYFKTKFAEYSLNAGINLVSLFSKNRSPGFNICLDGGVGIITYKSKLYNGNDDTVLDSYGYDEEKSSPEISIIAGIKAAYKISDHFYLVGQTSNRIVNTDLLDSKEGQDKRDFFNYSSIGLAYKIFISSPSSKSKFTGFRKYTSNKKRRNSKSKCATFN